MRSPASISAYDHRIKMNSSNETLEIYFCQRLNYINQFYLTCVIGGVGAVLNALNVAVFLKSSAMKGDMIKFLIVKSFADTYNSVVTMINFFWAYDGYFSLTAWFDVISLIFNIYLLEVAVSISILCEFMAMLDRYTTITGKFVRLKKVISFKWLTSVIVTTSFIVYSYSFFSFQLVSLTFEQNTHQF